MNYTRVRDSRVKKKFKKKNKNFSKVIRPRDCSMYILVKS